MNSPRRGYGTSAAQPRPFTAFLAEDGRVAVRIGTRRPFVRAREVIISAAPVFVTVVEGRIHIRGEGVVRQHESTIAITA